MSYTAWYNEPRDSELPEKTDKTKWRLEGEEGRQVWRYVESGATRLQRVCEKYFLGLDISEECPDLAPPSTPLEACENGIQFFSKIQSPSGHWANDYGGPMFLLPGLVITCYVTQTELPEAVKREMIVYLSNTQDAEQGGWGLHVEDHSNIFGTALNYCSMRLLGVARDDPRAVRAREFLHKNDGAKGIPSWGKFWLSVLGVYDWNGLNSVPPELWLLPDWVPLHPGRWWCHCRVVYLPMGFVYGLKKTGPITPLVKSLREELYTEPYENIDWVSIRSYVSPLDLYQPRALLSKILFGIVNVYESVHSGWVRRKALDLAIDHIKQEDLNTNHICIGPVNKMMNMLSVYLHEGKSEHFLKHVERLPDYLWLSADGMKMQGYNGSQLWDTAFTVQAIVESGLLVTAKDCLTRAMEFIDVTQVREDVPQNEKYYRHISKGAWPFSTRDHGWPISDCTAEGLKASLAVKQHCQWIAPLDPERYFAAVNVILSLQNPEGGWATYELTRSYSWLEYINPAEAFTDIMIDYSYVECTSASVQALAKFHAVFPFHRAEEVQRAIAKGAKFIESIQEKDGSWLGKWAVCFTYGTWFGVNGLLAAGRPASCAPIRKAAQFLLSKQREDGAWGEDFKACFYSKWVEAKEGQVVNTAWAVMTLIKAQLDDVEPIARGVQWIMQRQLPNGDWPQEGIRGVFNSKCGISYSSYKNTFSIWALGMFARHYPEHPLNAKKARL